MSSKIELPKGPYDYDADSFKRERPGRPTPQLVPRQPDEPGLEPAHRDDGGRLIMRGAVGPDLTEQILDAEKRLADLRGVAVLEEWSAVVRAALNVRDLLREVGQVQLPQPSTSCVLKTRRANDGGIKFTVEAGSDYGGEKQDGDPDEVWMLKRAAWEWGQPASRPFLAADAPTRPRILPPTRT